MARIPVYQESQAPNRLMAVSELSAPDAGAGLIGRSMKQVGQSLNMMANTATVIQNENGKAYALKASGQAKQEMTDYFLKSQETAQPGAEGFTKKFDTDYQAYANKLLEQAPDGAPRRFLATSLQQLRESLSAQSLVFEVTEGRAFRFNNAQQGIQSTADALYNNPSQQEYEKSRGEMQAGIDSMSLTPEQRRKLNEFADEKLTAATVDGQINVNPQAFLNSVNAVVGGNYDRNKLQTAQISVESSGVAGAISPKGATGLMQVMPTTAMQPGYELPSIFEYADSKGVSYISTDPESAKKLLKNPKIGAAYGQMYMDAMLKEYDNNLVHALVAYNWGPGNANKWIARGANPSQLPEETRNYIPKVLSKAGLNVSLDGKTVLTGNVAFDDLPFEKQQQYIQRANTRVKQQEAEYRVKLETQVADANAMAMNGIVDERALSIDDFVNAYGPEKGLKNFEVYRDNQTMAGDIGMLKTLPMEQLSRKVEAYKPEPGAGFELDQKRYDIMAQSAARVVKMRNDDPVRYAHDTNPDVQKSYDYYQTISADPTESTANISAATQDYVSKTIAEQQRLGVAEPRVLSNTELDNLSRRISSGNENAANLVLSIETMYGANYYPQVMDELLTAGKLSNAMVVIADLPNAGARESVARIANIKRSELEAGIDSVDIKDIKLNTTAVVQELRASAGPVTEQTAKSLAAYQDIVERQALEYIGTGAASNASDAVDMAKKLYLGHYQFDGTLRMPANMDSDYITNGLDRSLDTLYNNLTIVDVPQDLTKAYNANEALDVWKSAIDNNHFWVADNATEGAFLWVRTANGMSYKVLQGGEQYYMNYADMIATGMERDKTSAEEFRRQMLGIN
jgi:hypothetical protein